MDALPATAIGKIYKPALTADAVRRTVQAELGLAGLTGTVETDTRDGRPHAVIHVDGDGTGLATQLDRYSFGHTVARNAARRKGEPHGAPQRPA